MIADDMTLKLHPDDNGVVWYVRGANPPECSGREVLSFMLLPLVAQAPRVRILGTARNAHLITAMFCRKAQQLIDSVEVCAPFVCTPAQRSDPRLALLAMRTDNRPASTGGWHEVGVPDYHAYALIHQLQKPNGMNDHALRLLRSHPAWRALSFITTVDPQSVALLLSDVIDPRWYVDPQYPGRVSRMNTFLGLSAATQDAVTKGMRGRGSERCRLLMRCWQGQRPNKEGLKLPGNFLWRIKVMGGEPTRADLRANQVFVAFLRHTWLDALYAGRQSEPLFAPEHFFKTPAEVSAFKNHMATRQTDG